MRMPYPYCPNGNSIVHMERKLFSHSISFHLFPLDKGYAPGEIDALHQMVESVIERFEMYIGIASAKIAENTFMEHKRLNKESPLCKEELLNELHPMGVSLWADGSWAMVFKPNGNVLGRCIICVSFPYNRPSFTATICE